MYAYSPIKSIIIRNFRNIGDAQIDFDESPIVSLIGENESGKTSIVKAFGVCALHADARSQKDFIRDGTSGFGVAILLEDGTLVTRLKSTTGNRYQVKNNDGIVFDAVKVENEVPKAVQDVMGLIEEPETKEFLQIRTYEDQLLFVVTPASTNYKVMYDALKISQLTRAIKVGSTEANELKREISDGDTSVSTLQNSLAQIKTFDIEPLLNIKTKLEQEIALTDKLEAIEQLLDTNESMRRQLGALALLESENVQPIDLSEVARLKEVGRVLDSIESLEASLEAMGELGKASSIDTSLLDKLNSAVEKLDSIESMTSKAGAMVELSKAQEIPEMQISSLVRAIQLKDSIDSETARLGIYNLSGAEPINLSVFDTFKKFDSVIASLEYVSKGTEAVKQYDSYIDQVLNWMKQVGVSTTSCPKCGEPIIIDLELIK